MTTYNWNTTDGAFGSASSWTPTSGPPGAADAAVLVANGTHTVSGPGNAASITTGAGTWNWNGAITAQVYTINGTDVIGSGGSWTLVGQPINNNSIIVGSSSGGVGTVTVQGGGKISSTQAATTGEYAIYLGSDSLNGAAPGTGTINVIGAGSTLDTGANGIAIGKQGAGTLNVSGGATATFSSSDSTNISAIEVGRAGTGAVNVSSGSSVTAKGFAFFGRAGTGALSLSGASSFTGGSAANGVTPAFGIAIGQSTPSGSTSPAAYGGNGSAQVTQGSTLHSLGTINVGYDGSTGSIAIDGASSVAYADGTIQVGGGSQRPGGSGSVAVTNGGTIRSGKSTTGIAGFAIGTGAAGASGSVTVDGAGSLLDANGYRLSVGTATAGAGAKVGGTGTLSITNGARVVSGGSYSDAEAALAIGVNALGTGTVTVSGAGSSLVANGQAVIGGGNSGAGVSAGGSGTMTVASGGTFQSTAVFVEAGGSLAVDAASTMTAPTLQIDGGKADLATLSSSTTVTFGNGGALTLHAINGANTIANFGAGSSIDFAAGTTVSADGRTATSATGSVTIATQAGTAALTVAADGHGGTLVSLTAQTIGVFRFFEQGNGTHFYTSSATEANGLANPSSPSYRADLTPESNGFGALAQTAADPAQERVYRFFDATHGTEFLTASASEAAGLQAAGTATFRPDLVFEPNSSFYEHSTQQTGDVAVYRFFDSVLGTHFYTGSQSEYASLTTAGGAGYRLDLVSEGVGFYAPAGTYTPSTSA